MAAATVEEIELTIVQAEEKRREVAELLEAGEADEESAALFAAASMSPGEYEVVHNSASRWELVHEALDCGLMPEGGQHVWGDALAAMGGEYASFASLATSLDEQWENSLMGNPAS